MSEIAILVSSFERPRHLRRVLESLAVQRGVAGAMEVVVTDDGSRDRTPQIVRQFAATVGFPVRFVTHPHAGFQLARCRNEGVAASTAPYLLFLDGDCVVPPDHVRIHLDRRRDNLVRAGYCALLAEATSERMTVASIRRGDFLRSLPLAQRWNLFKLNLNSRFYSLLRHPTKPKLFGGNIGIWRSDYERVNGYDENFFHWGCEDDDLRLRLRRAGVQIESILSWTNTYHLWHPKAPSVPATWREGANVAYLHRPCRLTSCGNGLKKRGIGDLQIAVVGGSFNPRLASYFPRGLQFVAAPAEVEILVLPGDGTFSPRADCRIAWFREPSPGDRSRAAAAHFVLSEQPVPGLKAALQFPPQQLDRLLQSLLMRPADTASQPARRAA